MILKSKFQAVITLLFFAAVMFVACKKEASVQSTAVTDEEAQTITQENASAEGEYDDVTEIGLSAGADLEASAETNGGVTTGRIELFADLQFKIGPCVKITVEPNDSTFPKTVTINYGDGCLCRDGKFRKGAVILYFTAPIRRPGAVLTITLRDFYVNRAHIEGVKTITNLTENGTLKYSVQIKDGKISWPNGRGFTHDAMKVVTRISGGDTRTIRDDVYSIEGRSESKYANGITVTKNTETPLIKPVACNWIDQGILKVKINSREFFIDFGNGECDNKATIKWAGGEIIVTLP